ncbi:hypothetical protein ACIRP2_38970 [Streptomyces sp. NPDC101194]
MADAGQGEAVTISPAASVQDSVVGIDLIDQVDGGYRQRLVEPAPPPR